MPRFLAARLRAATVLLLLAGGLLLAGAPAATAHTPAQTTGASAADRPVLRYGSSGPAVRYLQQRLRVTPRSGWFGPLTRAAVQRYQRSHGIASTGTVAWRTWAALLGTSAGRASRSASRSTAGLDWAALARCESSGNPRAVSRSGRYHGLYQFDLSTWRSVGGTGSPSAASAGEQTRRAQILYASRGRSPWPYCGRYL